jgi:hypothetical protein
MGIAFLYQILQQVPVDVLLDGLRNLSADDRAKLIAALLAGPNQGAGG